MFVDGQMPKMVSGVYKVGGGVTQYNSDIYVHISVKIFLKP